MPVYELGGKRPKIGKGTWIAPSAEIIGDVEIGENCYIGFGAVIRGDFGPIRIGNETLVEENVVIHTATQTRIGNRVIIGHMVMIHDAVIMDKTLIGMKSMICENVTIGENTIVAEQSLIRKNTTLSSGKIVAGSPAKVVGDITERHRNQLSSGIEVYLDLIKQYGGSLVRVDN
jgi:carbonic anhydrase/acetyltransferase-like protein (isoleucine patch superfamily)